MSPIQDGSRPARARAFLVLSLLASGLIAFEHALDSWLAQGVLVWPERALLGRLALEAAVLLPFVALAAWLAARLERAGRARLVARAAGAAALCLLLVPALFLRARAVAGLEQWLEAESGGRLCSFAAARVRVLAESGEGLAFLGFALRRALLDQLFLLGLVLALEGVRALRLRTAQLGLARAASALLGAGLFVAAFLSGRSAPAAAAPAPVADRVYQVSAIHVNMTLNRWGDRDPMAYMYALNQNVAAVRTQERRGLPDRVSVGLRRDPIQPLVIRANVGETVQIQFTNRLTDGAAGLLVDGLPFTVAHASGTLNRPDLAVEPGETVTYTITVPDDPEAEHAYYLHDAGPARDRTTHGLFGALVIEPRGSLHLDPETGTPLSSTVGSNWEAIIQTPGSHDQPAFREYVLMYHEVGDEDFEGILDSSGEELPQVDDLAGVYRPAARAINYRSEPFRNRLQLHDIGKSHGYSSYVFGDPATPMPRSYIGEPTKTRLMHGGSEVFHVHHLHGGSDRWPRNPRAEDPLNFAQGLQKRPSQGSNVLDQDSESIGPGTSYDLEHECGAGGCQQAAGDFLFHCHIGHHYIGGMWSFWRVFDTRQADLAPVPGIVPPQAVDSRQLYNLVKNGLELWSLEGKRVVTARGDASTEISFQEFIEEQLPPQGVPLDVEDATVWNWAKTLGVDGPLYQGEPETAAVWPNYRSATPGARPTILFNPENGRYAWPLFRPHLGQRPPFTGNGHTGAPWLGERGSDKRPDGLIPSAESIENPGMTIRQYPITGIETVIPRSEGDVIEDGQLFVLSEDKDAVRGGSKVKEPLTIRSNVGDGVDILFTSELTDNPLNAFHSKTNMHTHMVQFDPQASDGVITGMSFEQSIRPYLTENRFLALASAAGTKTIETTHVDRLRPGVWIGIGLGEGITRTTSRRVDPRQKGIVPTCEVRRIVTIAGNVLTLDKPLNLAHDVGEAVGVEFVRYNWFSDVDFGTVFWHDHVDFKSWARGYFSSHIVEPRGASYHDPVTGAELRAGAIADIHIDLSQRDPRDPYSGQIASSVAPGTAFREVALYLNNAESLEKEGEGNINLRSAPLFERDRDFPFSSVTNGDPMTPLVRSYLGDPLMIRGLGVTDMVGALRVVGGRFSNELFPTEGTALTDTVDLLISDRAPLFFPAGVGATAGDYLYHSTITRDFESGAWGLIRVHDGEQASLRPLPGRPAPRAGSGFPYQSVTGLPPAPAGVAQSIAPPGTPVTVANVSLRRAMLGKAPNLVDGQAFMLDSVLASGSNSGPGGGSRGSGSGGGNGGGGSSGPGGGGRALAPEPLVLRIAAGEMLELNVRNESGQRAALTAGELLVDTQTCAGSAVGLNLDSSIAPGQTRSYYLYADDEDIGTTCALNLPNPLSGGIGAYAVIVVEPRGATFRNPKTGAPALSGAVADVLAPSGNFREVVLVFSDTDDRLGQNTMPYPTAVEGVHGINYQKTPLLQRGWFPGTNDKSLLDSARHGDPALVVEAISGDAVQFRVVQAHGDQGHVFAVEGHRFPREPWMEGAEQLSSDILMPGLQIEARLLDGAGAPGDYLIKDLRLAFFEAGLWGLFRVHPVGTAALLPLDHGELEVGAGKAAGRGAREATGHAPGQPVPSTAVRTEAALR